MPASSNNSILGLDLGTTSVGWCLVGTNDNGTPTHIIDAGVRIFPEGMDRTRGEKSLNQDRREARALRRQTYRRERRKTKLLHVLQAAGLLPKDPNQLAELMATSDPYQLRSLALDRTLEAFEIGRAIYHLGQRRGYLSNRKTGNDKEDGAVAGGIGDLRAAMQAADSRTLGEYLFQVKQAGGHARRRYTHRSMFQEEFDRIWQAQSAAHPKLLTADVRKQIFSAIFDQRPLKLQKHLIGHCEFEPDRKRAAAATWLAQEFRLWQTINHLRILQQNGAERPLTDTERQSLHDLLETKKTCSWEKAKREIGLLEGDRFNLESHRKSGLLGNQTTATVRSVLKKRWGDLAKMDWQSGRNHEALVNDLLNIENPESLKKRLMKYWELEEKQAEDLMAKTLGLPKGRMHLSQKAMRQILRHMTRMATPDNRGLTYSEACAAAGYDHTRRTEHSALPKLPFLGIPSRKGAHQEHSVLSRETLRNPMVERALHQTRRVVNGIIDKHGKPGRIRIELARDLKLNARQREEAIKRQRQNERSNETARNWLVENAGIPSPSRTDVIKYRLWQECDQVCPYTGKSINVQDLFGAHPQVDIEHIIPYTRCLDDSYMNKTLCFRDANATKGNRTPWEAYHGDETLYAEVLQRAKKLPYPKSKRFAKPASDTEPDFVSQQLNETRYIARLARDYLQQLGVDAEPVKGGTTAILRRAWGLNDLLGSGGEKTRLDHRHHAVDALVVALTDRRAVKQLSTKSHFSQGRLRVTDYQPPIPNLRSHAEPVISNIIISHKSSRKISGPLHKETLYGISTNADGDILHDEKGNILITIRKWLADLKSHDIANIKDARIRELAKLHLARHGDMKSAFGQTPTTFLLPCRDGSTRPIERVRLEYPLNVEQVGNGNRTRFVESRNNHHLELVEITDSKGQTKWIGHVVTLLEAYARRRKGTPIIEQNPTEGKYVIALHINDMVEMNHKGKRDYFYLQKMTGKATGRVEMIFRPHTDATEKADRTYQISKSPETLRKSAPRFVDVDAIGTIR